MRPLLLSLFCLLSVAGMAQKITGTIYNDQGDLLPFASITIKGTSVGVSANNKAKYAFVLPAGSYTLVCQHVGYETAEKRIELSEEREVDFILPAQKLLMPEVVIKKGEDPAYEIIRSAIKKRTFYNNEVNGFDCDLYSKDMVKLRNLPDRILGQKIPQEDRKQMRLDTSGKGIIYLSESISKVYFQKPNQFKMEVSSSRVSGSGNFGFTFPAFINLYSNNVTVFSERLNPRGFVSPIADGALKYYKYKFLGTFFENDKPVHAIRVIPRRGFEPLFSGTINITDEEWRIHSCHLVLTKTAQLEILDTLQIVQQYVPLENNIWRVKSQLLSFNFNMFKIDAVGNFLTVYSNYHINPVFDKKIFNNVIIKYDTGVNKKSRAYWDTTRPVPLAQEEQMDYTIKDSIYQAEKDSLRSQKSIDSLNRNQGRIKLSSLLLGGIQRTHYSKTRPFRWGIDPLLTNLQYNTAEGLVSQVSGYVDKRLSSSGIRLSVKPTLRYGFSNHHFNGWLDVSFRKRNQGLDEKINRNSWLLSGGKRVSQYNQAQPISPLVNSISTLFYGKNYMKTYENYFANIKFTTLRENGLVVNLEALYEDRLPLFNTTRFTFRKSDTVHLTENYPVERVALTDIYRHQAFLARVEITWKPGQRFIQFPRTKIPIGSAYPTFSFSYTKGIKGIAGSDADFDKWTSGVSDDQNLKLAGLLRYSFAVGGFLNHQKVFIHDYQHFNGNPLRAATAYVNSFQLIDSYGHSTAEPFFAMGHLEHHFNGMFTNKIPLFKRLNWNLVAGANAFYVNQRSNHAEFFVGLENILKIFRVDFVTAYEQGKYQSSALIIGAGGLLGGAVSASNGNTGADNSFPIGF